MTIRARRFLYLCSFFIFFILAPLLILYANGYRYNTYSNGLTKVGAFYVKSFPSGSNIFIDGTYTGYRTPHRVLNVTPGFHTVTVGRDGFESWQKRLEIFPGETTFIRDIVLFRNDGEAQILAPGGTHVIENSDKTIYAYLDSKKELHLTNTNSGNDFVIPVNVIPETLVSFSPDTSLILFTANRAWYTVEVNTEKTSRLALAPRYPVDRIEWDPLNHNLLWYLERQRLQTFDRITQQSQLRASTTNDFFIDPQGLFTVSRGASQATVELRDPSTMKQRWVRQVNAYEPLHIAAVNNGDLVTLVSASRLYLVDGDDTRLPVSFDVTTWNWRNEKLLLASDFEIIYYNASTRSSELVDRTSAPVTFIMWHPSGAYFLRHIAGTVQLQEIDNRDVRNSVTLATTTRPFRAIFNKKGDRLFMISTTTNALTTIQ